MRKSNYKENKKASLYYLIIDSAGFTMLELIISTAILASLLAIFLVNYHSTTSRSGLVMEAQRAVGNINLARSYSLSLKRYDNNVPAGGWGIYFSASTPSSYKIFADIDNDGIYDSGAGEEADPAKGGVEVSLPDGVTITDTKDGADVNLVFLPPQPDVYINGLADSITWFNLSENSGNTLKKIEINPLGVADIIE